jgi:hypothetical protein
MKLNEVFEYNVIIEQENVAGISDAADAQAFLARIDKRPRKTGQPAVADAIAKLDKRIGDSDGDEDLEAALEILKTWQQDNPLRIRKSPTDFDHDNRNRTSTAGSRPGSFHSGPRNSPF